MVFFPLSFFRSGENPFSALFLSMRHDAISGLLQGRNLARRTRAGQRKREIFSRQCRHVFFEWSTCRPCSQGIRSLAAALFPLLAIRILSPPFFFFPRFGTPRGRLPQWLRVWERRKSKAKACESCQGRTTIIGFRPGRNPSQVSCSGDLGFYPGTDWQRSFRNSATPQKTETRAFSPLPPRKITTTPFHLFILSLSQPLSLTINNKTVLPIVRGWEAPDGGVLSLVNVTKRHAAAVVNATTTSPNPIGTLLNETKKTVSGKNKFVKETVAVAFGKRHTTKLLNSITLGSGSVPMDMTCIVDPKTGSLVGLQKARTSLCGASGNTVTVPTSNGYISQIKVSLSEIRWSIEAAWKR